MNKASLRNVKARQSMHEFIFASLSSRNCYPTFYQGKSFTINIRADLKPLIDFGTVQNLRNDREQ